jgi:hypothetical protein
MTQEFFLASYPRSGNTMTRLLLEHHFDIDTRENSKAALRQNPTSATRTDLENLVKNRLGAAGTAYKTHHHEPGNLPALVLVRDGRDALVSYARYSVDLMNVSTPYAQLLHNRAKRSEWSDFYNWWVGGRPCRTPYVLISYEKLLHHQQNSTVIRYLQTALRKIGLDFEVINSEPLPGFEKYHKAKPAFFRRGIIGSWKDEMPLEVEEHFWKSNGKTMTWLGYER